MTLTYQNNLKKSKKYINLKQIKKHKKLKKFKITFKIKKKTRLAASKLKKQSNKYIIIKEKKAKSTTWI